MSIEVSSVSELKKHWQDQIHALDQSAIVAITDLKGVITYVNKMFCDLSEYSEEELLGATHSLINSGYHDSSFFKNMWQTIGRGEVWRGEVRNRAKSGKLYWVDTTIVPIKNDKGKLQQYIAIRSDITDRKKAEAALADERARLVESEKMASIGILSAGIAHELGNPLGAIRGRLEMLETMCSQETFEKELAIRSVHKMIENVDRMSKIIRALKNSARDGSQDAMQDFNLTQMLEDILEISNQKCAKHNIEVKTQGLDRAIVLRGRETEIGQVIVNLFNNAFDAVKGLANPWISLSLIDEPDQVTIAVADSGEGVKEELRHRIFDPFFTTKEVGEGTGLGLSICRSFVEGHGGRLYFEAGLEHSCFKVELPKNKETT